jgi:hypothetical protein
LLTDLERLLKMGRGGALAIVKQHYTADLRPVILNACLDNLAYDRQVEGNRANYMLEIIDATNDVQFYRDGVLDALRTVTPDADYYDIEQLYDLAVLFAERGDTEMREVIKKSFLAMPALGDFVAAHAVIELDGLDGFIFVAEHLSQHIQLHGNTFLVGKHRYQLDSRLQYALEDAVGESQTALAALRLTHPQLTPFLDIVEAKYQSPPHRKIVSLTYDEIRDMMIATKAGIDFYATWGRSAPYSEFLRAANDLHTYTNLEVLWRCLEIFQDRPYPFDPEPLFGWTQSEHQRVTIKALKALAKIRHPSVRKFALERIKSGGKVGRVVQLLDVNYEEGDWQIIEPLTQQNADDDDYHSLGFSIFDIFDHHSTVEFKQTLLHLYEHNPCSKCRERAVERLYVLEAIPEWMREECLHDANARLRKYVAKI